MRNRSGLILLLYLAACDRGCLSTAGLGGSSPLASAVAVKQDCPTGIARCVSGAVEVTEGRAACPGCPCAWKRWRVCERGCAIENVELVREREDAPSLCRHTFAQASLPPADASASTRCPNEGERFLCHSGIVHACPPDGWGVPVATCSNGCALEDETLADPNVDIATATSVMCSSESAHDAGVAGP